MAPLRRPARNLAPAWLVTLWGVLGLLAGCEKKAEAPLPPPSRVTLEHYERLQRDLPCAEAVGLLGEPTTTREVAYPIPATTLTWVDAGLTINVQCVLGKVQLKSHVIARQPAPAGG
jgi:hypothetical protein